jgi:hypothetical protein
MPYSNADILTSDPCGAQQKGLYAAQGVISIFQSPLIHQMKEPNRVCMWPILGN